MTTRLPNTPDVVSSSQDFWALFTVAANATVADAAVRAVISETVTRIGGLAGRRVAELGSGSGRCASAIAELGPAELVAIEKSPVLTAMSRDLYPQVDVITDNFTNLAAYGSFDVVFALAHVLFTLESADDFVAALRDIRAAMPDYGVLVVEQFDLTAQPRDYGSEKLRVHEHTVEIDPHRLQHTFTVSDRNGTVMNHTVPSLVLNRSAIDAAAREASFLIGDEWEYRSSNGELSRTYLLHAQKGFNYLSDLPEFLESWLHAAHPRNSTSRSITFDEDGRARPKGTLAWGQGASLSRHHAEFLDSLEPAIRPLVMELVTGWNFVTYSSCDGHLHARTPRAHYSESYCGVIAFDEDHELAAQRLLEVCCRDWSGGVVQPRIRTRPLLGPTSEQRAVDLLITRVSCDVSWRDYQDARDGLIEHLRTRLQATRGDAYA